MNKPLSLVERREYANLRMITAEYDSGNLSGNELEGAIACALDMSVREIQDVRVFIDGVALFGAPISGDLIARLV